uniref:F-box/kelch-repeat protein At3g06240-like n=1 Tax=Erigeron canadensis TaxID=72917 RepID=UPI001CB90580|nr:F-box/kelch-repeat protein At3g06240-like [Erigeron canadensis]
MTDDIPIEMHVEIMKRLPVKSVAVFRSVSKAWKSMIDSRLFITDYTNFHQHHRLLIRYEVVNTFPYKKTETKYVSIVDNDTFSQHEFDTVCNVPVSFQRLNKLDLVGTSHGLFCLSGYSREDGCDKRTALIWNPSLGKSIAVDVPSVYPVLGFGVYPDTFDPMIVMISNAKHPKPVLVFTLSSRVWRVPRGNLPAKSIYFPNVSPVATHDRCIYWKAFKKNINLVVSFDMVSEDFTEINLPPSVAHWKYHRFSISKIKESLALVEYSYDAEKQVCGVWIMVEDGVSKLFTKLFTINTFETKVLGFSKNDRPIMENVIAKDGVAASLVVYESSTGAIENVWIIGKRDSFSASSYTETLLLLDELDGQFVKIQLQF